MVGLTLNVNDQLGKVGLYLCSIQIVLNNVVGSVNLSDNITLMQTCSRGLRNTEMSGKVLPGYLHR